MMEEVALMLRSAVPIDALDRLLLSPTDGLAVVWVDLSERPDLLLLEGYSQRGPGSAIYTWFYSHPGKKNRLAGLRVEVRHPLRTVFHLVFKAQQDAEALCLISQSGKIWMISGPPPTHFTGTQGVITPDDMRKAARHSGPGLLIELDGELMAELRHQLETWEQATQPSLAI